MSRRRRSSRRRGWLAALALAAGCAGEAPPARGRPRIDIGPNPLLLADGQQLVVHLGGGPPPAPAPRAALLTGRLAPCERSLADRIARGMSCRRFSLARVPAPEPSRQGAPPPEAVHLEGLLVSPAPLEPAEAAARLQPVLSEALRPLGGEVALTAELLDQRIARALDYLLGQEWCQVTMTWVLDQVIADGAASIPPAVLARLRALRRAQLEVHRQTAARRDFLPLIDPAAAPVAPAPRRRDRMGRPAVELWLAAAINWPGVPLDRAVEHDLMQADGFDREHLTHQLLALAWLAGKGWGPREPVAARIQALARRVHAEQVAPRVAPPVRGQAAAPFTDLYVESLAFLAWAAPEVAIGEQHLELLLRNQRRDGSWLQSPHTTLDAVWLLAGVRRRLHSPASGARSSAAMSSAGTRLGSTSASAAPGTSSPSSASARRRAASTAGP